MRQARRFGLLLLVFSILCTGSLSARDWVKYPPWIEILRAQRVAAVGDIHGAFPQLIKTLKALKVAKQTEPESFHLTWTGKNSVLIFTGDLNDRGEYSREVFDAVMDLQCQAAKVGGRVITLLGNHEVLMLNGTVEHWANTLQSHKKKHYQNTIDSFTKAGLDYHKAISPTGKYGKWIRQRPLFAMINGIFFSHAGLPRPPTTKSDLAADYREAVEAEDWSGEGLLMNQDNVLWHREWWNDEDLVYSALKLLGAHGVVFGHTIGAVGQKGRIASKFDRVFSIDVGMTPAYGNSQGGGLIITVTDTGKMILRAVYPDRPEELLGYIQIAWPKKSPSLLKVK